MNVALRQPMTTEELLGWEEHQELRHEFDGVQPQAMIGRTFEHDAVQMRLVRALGSCLNGEPYWARGSNPHRGNEPLLHLRQTRRLRLQLLAWIPE